MRAERVAVVGFGRFGRALATLLSEAGYATVGEDPNVDVPEAFRAPLGSDGVATADLVFVCVPVLLIGEVLERLRPRLHSNQLVLDVCSVRAPAQEAMSSLLGKEIPWIGTHPLFGSTAIALGEHLRTVVCPTPEHPQAATMARAVYESLGCDVHEEDPADHDRSMAYSHALAFFIAKGMIDLDALGRTTFVPPSFKSMIQTIETVRSDAGHLFYAIERLNPFASGARRDLLNALARVEDELDAADPEHFLAAFATDPAGAAAELGALQIPSLESQAPELRETRDLIDEVDRDVLRLLARRSHLARRLGRIKGSRSLPVRDPAREREVLSARRQWAVEENLDPDWVSQLFERVMALARDEQAP